MAADALEVPTSAIRIDIADSDLGQAWFAGGSRGTSSWTWAITAAATDLREKLADIAHIPADGITGRADTAPLIGALEQRENHAHGAQFAEVAVDPSSGEVRVRRMLGIFAAGRIINPLTTRSQLIGGMTMGISMALHEEGLRDAQFGGQVNGDLAGYHVSAHADIPAIEADWVPDYDPSNPSGVKGVGEVAIVGTAAAVANAVWHATGTRQRSLPISLERILTTTNA